MYLLDTDILSNLMRRTPSTVLIARLAAVPPEQQFTSSITLSEMFYGTFRLGPNSKALLERLEQLLLPNLPVLPFDTEAAFRYGKIRAELESKGAIIGDADLRIAGIALARGLTLITGNVHHFSRVSELRFDNWLEP
jgi:tRNA(fMet)-specific endonuclease VapC